MRVTAVGPSKAGCHEIEAAIAERFLALGGEDIQVWDTDYIIDTQTQEAAVYAVVALELSEVSESPA